MTESEKVSCASCRGSGKCLRCDGSGNIVQNFPTPIAVMGGEVRGQGKSSRTCSKCYGSGMCQACKGTGKAS
jgi:DnaJ-class molecular chaperone